MFFISRMPTDLLQLVDSVRAGNPAATHLILVRHKALLSHICRRHLGHGMDFDDLMQEAQLGFLYGVRVKYIHSPEHNMTHLTSYCSRWARRNVRRAIQNMGSLIRVPVWLQDQLRRRGAVVGKPSKMLEVGQQILAGALALPEDDQPTAPSHRPFDRLHGDRLRRMVTARALRSLGLVHRVVLTSRAQQGLAFEEIGQELRRRGLRAEVPTFSQVRHLYRAAVVKVQKWMRRNRIGVEDVLG